MSSSWKDKQVRNLVFYPSGGSRKAPSDMAALFSNNAFGTPPVTGNRDTGKQSRDETFKEFFNGQTEERYRRVSTEELLQEVTKKLQISTSNTNSFLSQAQSFMPEECSEETASQTFSGSYEQDIIVDEEISNLLEEDEETVLIRPRLASPYDYPFIKASPAGILSVYLSESATVEISPERNIRVLLEDGDEMAVAVTKDFAVVGVMQRQTRIVQECQSLLAQFGRDKLAFGQSEALLCTSKRIRDSYLLSHRGHEPKVIPSSTVQFPALNGDFTENILQYMLSEDNHKHNPKHRAKAMIRSAHWDKVEKEEVVIHINDCMVKLKRDGGVDVTADQRSISLHSERVLVKTPEIVLGIEGDEKATIKWGKKKIFSNNNGLVVSDGYHTLTMDSYGRLLV